MYIFYVINFHQKVEKKLLIESGSNFSQAVN